MNRKDFIASLGIMGMSMTPLGKFMKAADSFLEQDSLMPVMFLGHGSPMNALADNDYTKALKTAAENITKPVAIMVVSAHWLTRGTYVSAAKHPATIHDFYGFPQELYNVNYPAPGTPKGAELTNDLLMKFHSQLEGKRGLDHGAWSVLLHMYPDADIPVYQLSIDISKPPSYLNKMAGVLKSLRKKGVLVIGSGNVTHNLGMFYPEEDAPVADWAEEFDEKVKSDLLSGDHQDIIDFENWGKISKTAHPSTDHFLPLMYAMGLTSPEDSVSFIHEGFQHGTFSMRCIQFG